MYIKEFPNSKYRFEFYVNYGKKTFQQIMREKNCDAIINTWFYDMAKYTNAKTSYAVEASTDCGVIVDGREIGKVVYNEYGICIDDDGNLFCATQSGQKNYAIGLPVQYKGGQRYPNNTSLPKNGCTHIGFKADGTPVMALVSKDKPMTNDALNTAMLKFGCVDILRYDGSWSSQGNLGGIVVQPSQTRIVQGYLLIFKRKTEKTIYRVQVGAFTTKWRADALSDKLKSEGYQTIVADNKLTKTPSQILIYRVQVGAFETKSLAEALEQKLKSEGYPTFLTNVKIMV